MRMQEPFSRWYAMGTILGAIALLAISQMLVGTYGSGVGKIYETDVGESQTARLNDGSTIQLNTATVIRVHYTAGRREITLLQGEANFKVAKDTSRPFAVRAGSSTIVAVGTQFSVRRHGSSMTSVLVTEGKVALTHPGVRDRIIGLVRGFPETSGPSDFVSVAQRAVDRNGNFQLATLSADQIEAYEAWRDGRLALGDRPLNELVAEFNRYNKLQLVIASPEISSLRLGGWLPPTAINRLLQVLHDSHDIEASVAPGRQDVILLRRASAH